MNSRQRSLSGVVALTVLAATLGWVAGRQIESPATAAARAQPPAASMITAPVESRVLTSDVVMRGDVTSDAAIDITVTPTSQGRAVVTTAPPEVGSELTDGSVALAIAGRPVFVVVGELPVYRDMTPGTSGDDVRQLEDALVRLGIAPGPVDGVFDGSAQAAVRELYARAGYQAPEPDAAERDQLAAARDAAEQARRGVTAAEAALTQARRGPSPSTRLQLDAAVNEAVAAREAARTFEPPDPVEVQRAVDAVAIAVAQRDEGLAAPDTTMERQAAADAEDALGAARASLDDLEARTGVTVPQSELVFVRSLPARVDVVHVERGAVVTDKVLTVSGGQLQVSARVDAADRPTLRPDQPVTLEDQTRGLTFTGRIASVADQPSRGEGDAGAGGGTGTGGEGYAVVITPDPLPAGTTEDDIRDLNVKVTIAVTSTDGAVLAVPAAAVTAGTGGTSRVERQVRHGRTETVEVTTGLSAAGFVEVTPVGGELGEGDLVVVGR